jgi:hypothetical protein
MARSASTRREIAGAAGAGAVVVAFCLLLLWHDPLIFWNDDYELSILPVFADVARSWNEWHFPLLSPYSWVCSNLAGEFQYGTFSIFINAAVILIWKFPLAFAQQAAALAIAHLFVLAAGAFLLARQRQISEPFAVLVGLVAALNGWIICWGATDWFGALGAFAWLPWAWWGLERALESKRSRWRFLWPAPFVYLVVTGGFPYTVVMLGLIAVWLSIRSLVQTRKVFSILPLAAGVALGFGLSAPAWLALLDYVQGSARAVTSATAHKQWVVPPASLPGFVLPCWTVNWADFFTRYVPHRASELACGLVPPAALIAGLLSRGRELIRRIGWDLFLLLVLLCLSMLPSAGVFRWSFRWLPLIHLVLVLCAAQALQSSRAVAFPFRPGVIGFLLVTGGLIMMQAWGVGGPHAFPFAWIVLGLSALWAASEFLPEDLKARSWIPAGLTFVILLATYLCIPPNCGVPRYNLAQQLTESAPLDPQRLYLSVYPQAEITYRVENNPGPIGQIIRPGSTSMWGRLRFVNGYSPILPAGVAHDFYFTIHGEIDPNVGDYLVRDQAGRAGILEQLGVDGLVIAREVEVAPPASDWDLVFSKPEGRVFHRREKPFATVRSVNWIETRPDEEFAVAATSDIQDSRNEVHLEVDVPSGGRPALLTFTRPYFRGYEAWLGANRLAVSSYRGMIPVVEVPAGLRGRMILRYRPWWLIGGGGVAVFSLIILVSSAAAAIREQGKPKSLVKSRS